MDKIVKKAITILILLLLVLSMVGGLFASVGASFSGNEDEWLINCSDPSFVKNNAKACADFKKYLQDKKNESDKILNDLKGQIGSITGDIAKDNKIIQALDAEGHRLDKEITFTESLIKKKQIDIDKMNQQIVVRENDIEKKKELAKDYMVHMQGTSRVNSYFDFLLAADSFVELSRRVEGLNLISKKNNENIVALNEERKILEENRLDLVFDQKQLEENVAKQKSTIEKHKELQEDSRLRIAKLREKHAALIDAQEAAEAERKLVDKKIDSIVEPEVSTGALIRPISQGYRVTAGVWRYPNVGGPSGVHIGIDIAAGIGTPLLAPANGMAIALRNDCATIGGFPSPNCSGYGNYLLMIVNNNGNIYGILYGHMRNNGVMVRVGQSITAGQKVGEVGSSGTSTGAHVHGEVYFLGTDSVAAAYDRWYNGPRNNNFGAGGKNVEYANRCEVKGMKAPCRLNPMTMWGLQMGDRG